MLQTVLAAYEFRWSLDDWQRFPEDALGKSIYDVIRLNRERFREFNERVCRGERGSLEFDIIGLQGERRNMETLRLSAN